MRPPIGRTLTLLEARSHENSTSNCCALLLRDTAGRGCVTQRRLAFAEGHQPGSVHASGTGSGDNFTDHFPMHVRQSIVATTVTIRESFVVESHQMKNGRVQIMDMHTVFHSRQTKLIR